MDWTLDNLVLELSEKAVNVPQDAPDSAEWQKLEMCEGIGGV